jgi:hypothetical protein
VRLRQPYGKRFADSLDPLEPRHKYFIASDGKKTEYAYFKGLIEARKELRINPLIEVLPVSHSSDTKTHPMYIVEETRKCIDESNVFFTETDFVCVIFDRDAHSFTEEQFDTVLKECQKYDYRMFISNPCFELWLLFHFSDVSSYNVQQLLANKKEGNRTAVEIILKDDFLGGSYNKVRLQFKTHYQPRVALAIENAKRYAQRLEDLKTQLGSNVGVLVEELLS